MDFNDVLTLAVLIAGLLINKWINKKYGDD
ncbi:hypothetical protein LaPh949_gp018 [Lactococcus phage 949]|uniref:Uncharacterized protein n=11 Tax=Audreyjarvisvirus TaxID=2843351 RepID=A0A1W6JLF0_9CAUD|nr:hypothetical protein LaPh949_gp018 [Lactococcus phage 949]YP_009904987.1 hypothetical protein H1Z30_gp018 [Lactococcus phage AM1]YP_009905345.1 hypothetical protein H1Z35_gp020 [Lactococcus phage AM4]YP_009905539.1 hypothetical protein H1Z36_gp020 [Lactococcus phage P1048]ARM66323.1 hypothetical protein AM2_018 [Lactococcus phage AM2]ARM66500.1 hypothetical protein AM3_018 [Lactococcus phage AM3]ARM66873.1 hypothetical protein AM5_020 [Lactococcus phage AM5]ARM67053.1 hypothetical protein